MIILSDNALTARIERQRSSFNRRIELQRLEAELSQDLILARQQRDAAAEALSEAEERIVQLTIERAYSSP